MEVKENFAQTARNSSWLEKSQDSGPEGERGQVGGLFIPTFNALPSVPISSPSQTHFPIFFSFLLSILSLQSSPLPRPSSDNQSHLESSSCVAGTG